jgi:hypothetical protein
VDYFASHAGFFTLQHIQEVNVKTIYSCNNQTFFR